MGKPSAVVGALLGSQAVRETNEAVHTYLGNLVPTQQLQHLDCTITYVPKPGEQDQNDDQEEGLKIPPIITAFEDATLLCASKSL